jgi:uncharacterized protein YaaW (UPF0174 family)
MSFRTIERTTLLSVAKKSIHCNVSRMLCIDFSSFLVEMTIKENLPLEINNNAIAQV